MAGQRVWWWGLAFVAVGAAVWYRQSVLSEPAAGPAPVVVFVTGGSGPYWQLAASGAKAAAKDHDVKLKVEMPAEAESLQQQSAILDKIDLDRVGGVAVSPLDASGQTKLINKMAKQLFVVTFDSDAPDSDRQGYVGTSNFGAGRTCAGLLAEAVPEGGKVAVLLANLTKDNLLDRKGGFQEALARMEAEGKAPKFEVVDFLIDDGDNATCERLIRDTLAAHEDLACIVGMNARHGPVLLKVLREEDKLGKIKIIAFDDLKDTLDGIEAGHIFATVAQDPYRYGYESVRMLGSLCRAEEVAQPIGKTTFSVSAEAIRKDNLQKYRDRLKARETPSEALAGRGS